MDFEPLITTFGEVIDYCHVTTRDVPYPETSEALSFMIPKPQKWKPPGGYCCTSMFLNFYLEDHPI